jgi:class I fructose-bisphosphate aldolase
MTKTTSTATARSMTPRLRRLFAGDGRCFDVAVDHGFFGELPFMTGIESPEVAIATLVLANPDAIQLTVGLAPILQAHPGRTKPALVLRTDVANVYGREIPRRQFSAVVDGVVDQALRLDAACVVCNVFAVPGQPELLEQCIRNVARLKAETEPVGMPLMVEPLVMRLGDEAYDVDGDPDKIVPLVRQAVELGADVIKADPTDDLDDYGRVIEAAGGVPVLVRGGGRAPDEVLLRRTEAVLRQGAAGIVYGRNVIQHDSPERITRALMSIVHDGAAAGDVLSELHADA